MNTAFIQEPKTWFTSDWHLSDDRIGIDGKPNLFYRPFKSVKEQNLTIVSRMINSGFKDGDFLCHLGDVCYKFDELAQWALEEIKNTFPNSTFYLIVGNYDEKILHFLEKYFYVLGDDHGMKIKQNEILCYLNHYPAKCVENMHGFDLAITGHIHGLWKVQKNMINVGVDAWHFYPVSSDTIAFCFNAMKNYYDENVFIKTL